MFDSGEISAPSVGGGGGAGSDVSDPVSSSSSTTTANSSTTTNPSTHSSTLKGGQEFKQVRGSSQICTFIYVVRFVNNMASFTQNYENPTSSSTSRVGTKHGKVKL